MENLSNIQKNLEQTETYYNYRILKFRGENILCCINDFMFTNGIIIGLTEIGYYGRFCFDNQNKKETIDLFNSLESIPDNLEEMPGNWIKYKGTGGEISKKDILFKKHNCKKCNGKCNTTK